MQPGQPAKPEMNYMKLGMPYIHVSAALHLDYSGYTPLCLYGWPHQTTPAALARNREGVEKFVKLVQSNNAGIRAYAKSAGIKIDWDDLSSTTSPLASITQTPRAFDFESAHWPSQFHHTGPFHDGKGRALLDEVLTDPTYRDNARKMQRVIAEANGLSVAADQVEESLRRAWH